MFTDGLGLVPRQGDAPLELELCFRLGTPITPIQGNHCPAERVRYPACREGEGGGILSDCSPACTEEENCEFGAERAVTAGCFFGTQDQCLFPAAGSLQCFQGRQEKDQSPHNNGVYPTIKAIRPLQPGCACNRVHP